MMMIDDHGSNNTCVLNTSSPSGIMLDIPKKGLLTTPDLHTTTLGLLDSSKFSNGQRSSSSSSVISKDQCSTGHSAVAQTRSSSSRRRSDGAVELRRQATHRSFLEKLASQSPANSSVTPRGLIKELCTSLTGHDSPPVPSQSEALRQLESVSDDCAPLSGKRVCFRRLNKGKLQSDYKKVADRLGTLSTQPLWSTDIDTQPAGSTFINSQPLRSTDVNTRPPGSTNINCQSHGQDVFARSSSSTSNRNHKDNSKVEDSFTEDHVSDIYDHVSKHPALSHSQQTSTTCHSPSLHQQLPEINETMLEHKSVLKLQVQLDTRSSSTYNKCHQSIQPVLNLSKSNAQPLSPPCQQIVYNVQSPHNSVDDDILTSFDVSHKQLSTPDICASCCPSTATRPRSSLTSTADMLHSDIVQPTLKPVNQLIRYERTENIHVDMISLPNGSAWHRHTIGVQELESTALRDDLLLPDNIECENSSKTKSEGCNVGLVRSYLSSINQQRQDNNSRFSSPSFSSAELHSISREKIKIKSNQQQIVNHKGENRARKLEEENEEECSVHAKNKLVESHDPVERQHEQIVDQLQDEQDQEPAEFQNEQEPVEFQDKQEPTESQDEPEPIEMQDEPEPVDAQDEQELIEFQAEQEPVESQDESEPVNSLNESEPIEQQRKSPVSVNYNEEIRESSEKKYENWHQKVNQRGRLYVVQEEENDVYRNDIAREDTRKYMQNFKDDVHASEEDEGENKDLRLLNCSTYVSVDNSRNNACAERGKPVHVTEHAEEENEDHEDGDVCSTAGNLSLGGRRLRNETSTSYAHLVNTPVLPARPKTPASLNITRAKGLAKPTKQNITRCAAAVAHCKKTNVEFKQKPPTAPNVAAMDNSLRRVKRTNNKNLTNPRIPSQLTRDALHHYTGGIKFTAEAFAAVEDMADEFWTNTVTDLEAFAEHAGRPTTVERQDIELLMSRQGVITKEDTVEVLIERFLPLEYRQELIPVARAGNRIELINYEH